MKLLELFLRVAGLVAVLLGSLVPIASQVGLAQTDPLYGTWVANVAKSKYSPGPPPKSNTLTIERAGQGLKVGSKGVDAEGKPTGIAYTANFDGKDYPLTGSPDYDTTALKRVDANTTEQTRKKAGKVVATVTYSVSKDGKVLTITVKGTNAKDQTVNNVVVWEKQ